ncbi:hypothetical protein VZT92_003231 [Zoarces viviparus]|uniref:Uncharacterized protein n=1 Tax=Zoarces viviparus TaxID=48416 RepID=A0AAW1G2X6_ZOAVI
MCCVQPPHTMREKGQTVPTSTSSSYPCGVADRQDAQLRLTVFDRRLKAMEAARPTDQTPALREKPL